MPERSAAASAHQPERICFFLRRGPHLARNCSDRNKHNGEAKQVHAKGKTGPGNGKGSGAVSVATAFTIAARPRSEVLSDDSSGCGVEYADEVQSG